MRKENGILIFENLKEENEAIFDGKFEGILITNRPGVILSCDVIKVSSKKMKSIANIDSKYLYSGNKGNELKNKMKEILNIPSMEMEIAISCKISHIFNV